MILFFLLLLFLHGMIFNANLLSLPDLLRGGCETLRGIIEGLRGIAEIQSKGVGRSRDRYV